MKSVWMGHKGVVSVVVVVFVILGVLVVGTVAAGAYVLTDDLVITVENRSCGPLDIAKGSAALNLNFLPGIEVPAQINTGETAKIQIPRKLIGSVSLTSGSFEVQIFNQSFSISTSSLDMEMSTLDGSPMSSLTGTSIDLSQDHVLVLECR